MLTLAAFSALFASAFLVLSAQRVTADSWLSLDDLRFTNEEIEQALRETYDRLEA